MYLASALQYICSAIVALAGNEAEKAKKTRINPRHVMLAIRSDCELNKLIGKNADFMQTGVAPNIAKELIKNGKKGGKDTQDDDIDMNDE